LLHSVAYVTPDPAVDRVAAIALDDTLRGHLRYYHHGDDALLLAYITAATEWYEDAADRSLITATWEARWDCFPGQSQDERCGPAWAGRADRLAVFLPKAPAIAVTSVKYLSTDNVETTLSSAAYTVEVSNKDAYSTIVPAVGYSWPSVLFAPGAVRVRFTAGYGATALTVPQRLKQVLRLLVAHWYTPGRQPYLVGETVNELPMTLKSLFWSTRAARSAA